MKNYFYLFTLICNIFYAQVGIETIVPEAQLDIISNNKGILIPRVDLTSLLTELPIINPQGGVLEISTIVFHKGTNGIEQGFYFWDGIKWKSISSSNEDENSGLQFYVFSGTGGAPNIEKSSINYIIYNSGLWTSILDNNSNITLKNGLNNNYMLFLTGTYNVVNSGNFQIQSTSDDGVKVIIDGVPILNQWNDQGVTTHNSTTIYLAKGNHKFEFWFFENAGDEFMQFNWLQNSNGSLGIINAKDFVIK